MFWKNAKTLKYEYIQRGRDVVSALASISLLRKISAISACLCVCVFVVRALRVAALYFLRFHRCTGRKMER